MTSTSSDSMAEGGVQALPSPHGPCQPANNYDSDLHPQSSPPQPPSPSDPPTPIKSESYSVDLLKDVGGLGIYFTNAGGAAIVDRRVPFYRLPGDQLGPGEASSIILPGDRLVRIQDKDVREWTFAMIVDELRGIPAGPVGLAFERVAPPPAIDAWMSPESTEREAPATPKRVRWRLFDRASTVSSTGSMSQPSPTVTPPLAPRAPESDLGVPRSAAMDELLLDMERRLRVLEGDVEREKKCRFLAERKNILYRNALQSLSEENAELRFRLARGEQQAAAREGFTRGLQLRI